MQLCFRCLSKTLVVPELGLGTPDLDDPGRYIVSFLFLDWVYYVLCLWFIPCSDKNCAPGEPAGLVVKCRTVVGVSVTYNVWPVCVYERSCVCAHNFLVETRSSLVVIVNLIKYHVQYCNCLLFLWLRSSTQYRKHSIYHKYNDK